MPAFFQTVKNGYNPDEVDRHLNNLESVINSYKEKDAAISNAIVNAQIAADNIIKNAELAAADIRKNAVAQLEKIEDSLENQRKLVDEFKEDYNLILSKYLTKVNNTDIAELKTKIDTLDKFLKSLKSPAALPANAPAEK
ncbi:MAG: DivIVA domain-containing protein [Clostridiales bacterium]|nr:DivIVA domain-containing protein [Clostridiales bacterium]